MRKSLPHLVAVKHIFKVSEEGPSFQAHTHGASVFLELRMKSVTSKMAVECSEGTSDSSENWVIPYCGKYHSTDTLGDNHALRLWI